jgi:hypothetical protein
MLKLNYCSKLSKSRNFTILKGVLESNFVSAHHYFKVISLLIVWFSDVQKVCELIATIAVVENWIKIQMSRNDVTFRHPLYVVPAPFTTSSNPVFLTIQSLFRILTAANVIVLLCVIDIFIPMLE